MLYHSCRSATKRSATCRIYGICCSANEFVCRSMHVELAVDIFSHSHIEAYTHNRLTERHTITS